jgi:hypothetical protein
MSRKNAKAAAPARSSADQGLKFISIPLDQIVATQIGDELAWTDHCGFQPALAPTVRPTALTVLQILSPMVVTCLAKTPEEKRTYRLCAGRRTYQLHAEQLSGKTPVKVIVVTQPETLLPDAAVFDALVQRLILAPDETAKGLIATKLSKDEALRSRVNTFLRVQNQSDICDLLGFSRQTLHRTAGRMAKVLDELKDQGSGKTARIGVLDGE